VHECRLLGLFLLVPLLLTTAKCVSTRTRYVHQCTFHRRPVRGLHCVAAVNSDRPAQSIGTHSHGRDVCGLPAQTRHAVRTAHLHPRASSPLTHGHDGQAQNHATYAHGVRAGNLRTSQRRPSRSTPTCQRNDCR
jgi:hypothetical protein